MEKGVKNLFLSTFSAFALLLININFISAAGVVDTMYNIAKGFQDFFLRILTPILGALLGTAGKTEGVQFLMMLTFVLITLIVSAPLKSTSLFGDGPGAVWLNWIVAIIVSIIGVRFMPPDMWLQLTAPSSAFVAAMLVGLPFLAMFWVVSKVKSSRARKLFWIIFMVFLTYLIVLPTGDFKWVYYVFLGLAFLMLVADGTIMNFLSSAVAENDLAEWKRGYGARKRSKLKKDMKEYRDVLDSNESSIDDKKIARHELRQLQEVFKKTTTIKE